MKLLMVAATALALSVSAVSAKTYALFDHNDRSIKKFDYGLRVDGLNGKDDPSSFWSFEDGSGASLATMVVDIPGGKATVAGQMRSNDGGALWDLKIFMDGVASLTGIGAGDDSFGATSYRGTLKNGGTTYEIVGKAKDVKGTGYEWTFFTKDPGGNTDWRAPNITAGWLSSIDGGANMLTGTNDFIGQVIELPPGVPNPIPLPAAGWLLIAGLGGLYAVGRRRKSA